MAVLSRQFTIAELVSDTSVELPIIAEVQADYKETSLKLKKGELLWLTQLIEEEAGNEILTVEGSRWDAPDFIFSIKITSRLLLSLKPFSSVKDHISIGPVMDVTGLANIAKPSDIVFGIPAEEDDASGVFAILKTSGRVVVHGRERVTGFLAKGAYNPLMIPGDFRGHFTQVSMRGMNVSDKPTLLNDLVRRLPIQVMYTCESQFKSSSVMTSSPDELTLQKESPITILAMCRFTATLFSLHDEGSTQPPFHASFLYPDYCKLSVRPASPIPLHAWAIDKIAKPSPTVQILTQEQFQAMKDRLHQSPPPVPAHSPSTKTSSAKSSHPDAEPIYEEAPPDARRRVLPPDREQSVTVYEVSPRRSIKRKNKRDVRKSKSDLGFSSIPHREYVNILQPPPSIGSDGYMTMKPVPLTATITPTTPPRQHAGPGSTSPSKNTESSNVDKRKPIPMPRADQAKAASLPRTQVVQPAIPLQRPKLQKHLTDSAIATVVDEELDYGQDYTLITPAPAQGRDRKPRSSSGSDRDYGGTYEEAFEQTSPHQSWIIGEVDGHGYLKPRKK